MKPEMPATLVPPAPAAAPGAARAVLLVDDEPQARKWFARAYGDEFVVLVAADAQAALALLAQRGPEVAWLLTQVRERHPHIVRLLFTAYADKDMALAAVNQGQVHRILEKPLDETLMR